MHVEAAHGVFEISGVRGAAVAYNSGVVEGQGAAPGLLRFSGLPESARFMHLILEFVAGPSARRESLVRNGQTARIGRTEWADICFPEDAEMADVHFEIKCQSGRCEVQEVAGAPTTLVNGKPVERAEIHDGDEIRAGQSTFRVRVVDPAAPAEPSAPATGDVPSPSSKPEESPQVQLDLASELCRPLDLEEEAIELLDAKHTTEQFFAVLRKNDCLPSAVKVLARWLPKPRAVAWGVDCYLSALPEEKLSNEDTQAIQAARQWAVEPKEQSRLIAQRVAEKLEHRSPPAWLAAAAAVSAGSMSPPDLPAAPPPDHLTGALVAGVIMSSLANVQATEGVAALNRFLDAGCKLLEP